MSNTVPTANIWQRQNRLQSFQTSCLSTTTEQGQLLSPPLCKLRSPDCRISSTVATATVLMNFISVWRVKWNAISETIGVWYQAAINYTSATATDRPICRSRYRKNEMIKAFKALTLSTQHYWRKSRQSPVKQLQRQKSAHKLITGVAVPASVPRWQDDRGESRIS